MKQLASLLRINKFVPTYGFSAFRVRAVTKILSRNKKKNHNVRI